MGLDRAVAVLKSKARMSPWERWAASPRRGWGSASLSCHGTLAHYAPEWGGAAKQPRCRSTDVRGWGLGSGSYVPTPNMPIPSMQRVVGGANC